MHSALCVHQQGVIVYKTNSQSQLFEILVGRFQIPHLHTGRGGIEGMECVYTHTQALFRTFFVLRT